MKFPRCNVLVRNVSWRLKERIPVRLYCYNNVIFFFFFFFFNLCAIYWDFPNYKHSSGPGFSEVLHIKNLSLFLI